MGTKMVYMLECDKCGYKAESEPYSSMDVWGGTYKTYMDWSIKGYQTYCPDCKKQIEINNAIKILEESAL